MTPYQPTWRDVATTRLAFYRGQRKVNRKSLIGDWLICWVTDSPYSHVALVASMWPAWAEVLSSSLRDGGVRAERANLGLA